MQATKLAPTPLVGGNATRSVVVVSRTRSPGCLRLIRHAATDSDTTATSASTSPPAPQQQQQPAAAAPPPEQQPSPSSSVTSSMDGTTRRKARVADSTDPVASFLSRRFGLAGGLGWLGILAVGTLGEQIKTRLEVAAEKAGTTDVTDSKEVVLPSGVRYTDLRVGGGQRPIKGYLVLVDYVGRANGEVFESTKARGKPIVYLFGSRPFTGGICAGVEEAMLSMKAGGKRRIVVPAALGFGEQGSVLRPTEHVPEKQGIIPGGAELEYELELLRVSIPPS